MTRTIVTLALGVSLGIAGMCAVEGTDNVRLIAMREISEKLDGHETNSSVVEVTLGPGVAGKPHRHPGPVFGYVLEGTYELGIDDKPTKILKAGETFYEPTGCLHRVSKNPAEKGMTRVIAVVLHPRDAKQLAIPEPADK